jgi:small subunit ribosomal protein S21
VWALVQAGPRTSVYRLPEGSVSMPLIKVKDNESIERALKRFKKKCEKEGVIQDIKKSSRFLKPSERKRKKALKAEKRRRQAARKKR